MKQAGRSRSSEAIAVQLPCSGFPTLPTVAVATIVLVAVSAYFAGTQVTNNTIGRPGNELLRNFPLLITVVFGIAVAITIRNLHRSELRNQALAQANSELLANSVGVREMDGRYRLMFHGNPLPMYLYDCESLRLVDVNEAAIKKYGYSSEQFLELRVSDIRSGVDAADLVHELQARHPGFNHAGVWYQRRKDGSLFSAEVTVLSSVQDGRHHELVLANDVTEKVEAEEALRDSRSRLRSLVDRAPFGICRSSLAGDRLESANPALCEMLGYSEEELLGLSLSKEVYSTTPNWLELLDLLKRDRKLLAQEAILQHKDGRQIRVRGSAFLAQGRNGELDEVEAYIEDLTEQSTLEQQIRAVQKLEAVGRLAGGVAHDFNNILVVIKLSTEMMLNQITPDSPLTKSLLQVSNAADRAAALTKQMLAFSRRQMLQVRVVNVNSIVNEISHLLRRIIGEDVRLVTKMADNLANTKLDPDQLGQVVLNLAVNARDAMPGGGTLHIETENVQLDEVYAKTHPPVQPGSYVLLAVSDTGTGIAKPDLPHIFDPFFTTKELGKGTGLGLSIVYGIVKQSGGYIWAYSEPRQGTTFKLYFPVTNSPSEALPHRTDIAGHATGQTILVVEDEAAIRGNVRDCLKQLGYVVLEADSGESALRVCERNKKEIDLVMTDLIMPGIGGQELTREVVERFPHIRVLVTSGYTADSVALRQMLREGTSFLAKPFSVAELSSAVHRALVVQPRHSEECNADVVTLSSA
jgi:two-component system cell cycle sensor histidine kinase/response regulator CckA